MNEAFRRAEEELKRRKEESRADDERDHNITREDIINLDDSHETTKERILKRQEENEKSLADWRAEAEAERIRAANTHEAVPHREQEIDR